MCVVFFFFVFVVRVFFFVMVDFEDDFPAATCINDQTVAQRSFLIDSVPSSTSTYRLRTFGSFNCASSLVSDQTPALCSCQNNGNYYFRIWAQGTTCSTSPTTRVAATTIPTTTRITTSTMTPTTTRVTMTTRVTTTTIHVTTPPAPLVGDLNGDGKVNKVDLEMVLSSFGPCSQCAADLVRDGTVNSLDLAMLIDRWRI
jgi:hypothetical protein